MSERFDPLGQVYEDMFALPWRAHMESVSVFRALGPVEGRRVLDIGCGTGLYSRELKRRGAGPVLGYDLSEGMLEVARRAEARQPLGVRYTREPLSGELSEGAFDLALGVYVLPYVSDYASLVELCSLAARALRPGGRFVTLPVNPSFHADSSYYARYGLRLWETEPRADASEVTLELCFGPYQEHITAHYWSRATVERALREAGCEEINWPDFTVSQEGIDEYSREFFQPYLDCPHAAIVVGHKRRAGS
ncbi:class I SAM-dependent methyltransferase [Streptomyces axinellae]|uniref:Methyltransferase domain-containing protein n=1 Tax=Streptomyces axinellae TaxID=552788 RepID=A0ABP6C3E1_9ACTN